MSSLILGLACDGEGDTYQPTDGPQVVGLRLSPDPATERDTLTCEWDRLEGATEATVAWELDGAVISGLEETTLDGTWFDKGDKVRCRVTPVADGAEYFRSNRVRIEDAPPEMISVVLTPEEPNENHILLAEHEASDPDEGDELRMNPHYRWWVIEGGEGDPEVRGIDENALGQIYWAKGDVVFVEAWVNALGEPSERMESDPVVIGNAPPEAPVVVIEEATDVSSLTCSIVDYSVDLDGDTVSYTYAWRRYGTLLEITDAELSWPDPGAAYSCEATPTDGEDDGEAGVAHHEVTGDPLRYRWTYDDAGARAGEVLVRFPDADGDGIDELLVATTASSLESVEGGGAVMLNSRAVTASDSSTPGSDWVYRTLTSPNQKQHFGQALGAVPDLDGDTFDEIVVGAPEAQDVERVSGLVAVVPSSAWRNSLSFSMSTKQEQDAMWWFPGDADGALMGTAVAGLDANGDGVGDIAAGALYQHDSDQGNVTIIDGTRLEGTGGAMFNDVVMVEISGNGGRFGQALTIGDHDGDGLDDLAVGAPGESEAAGAVYFFDDIQTLIPASEVGDTSQPAPSPFLTADDATLELTGQTAGESLGEVLAVGDVSGDGLDDLLLGAPTADSGAGAVYLWVAGTGSSGWTGYVIVGDEGDELGVSASAAGDLDGGGIGEVIVGAIGSETTYARGGAAYVFAGEDWGTGGTLAVSDALYALPAEAEGERFGYAVLGGLDFDGDGRGDLAVGAPGIDDSEVGVDVGGLSLWVDPASL